MVVLAVMVCTGSARCQTDSSLCQLCEARELNCDTIQLVFSTLETAMQALQNALAAHHDSCLACGYEMTIADFEKSLSVELPHSSMTGPGCCVRIMRQNNEDFVPAGWNFELDRPILIIAIYHPAGTNARPVARIVRAVPTRRTLLEFDGGNARLRF